MPEAFFQEEGRDQVARFQGGLAGHPAQHVGPPEPPQPVKGEGHRAAPLGTLRPARSLSASTRPGIV